MTVKIGVDLGGTNVRVAAFGDGPAPLLVRREPVGAERAPEAVVKRLAALIEEVRDAAGAGGSDVVPVGVGVAAMLRDRAGTVANAPNLAWFDVPFGAMLAHELGTRRPLGVYNDVNALTWGELCFGNGAGAEEVLAVYVGTGIGGGIVCDGRLVEGKSNTAGEIGHTKVRWDDKAVPCNCGGRGCVEAYLGGHRVQERARQELARGAKSMAVQLAGAIENVTPGDVDQAAAAGDEWALGLWTELAPLLGVTLANAIAVLNPELLILGGGMLSRTPVLREHVLAAMTVAATPPSIEPLTVRDAALGDDGGVLGAALLAEGGVSIIPVR